MTDRITMKHKDYPRAIARPLAAAVPQWEAKGWTVCPARGLAPAEKRAPKTAKVKGQSDDQNTPG